MMGAMEDGIRGRTEADAELSGRQKGEREPLMLPAAEERKMLPAGEERKLLPSGESDEKTMMAAFEGNTGQNQPIGVDAEIPAGAKAGEATFIEGAKDKTAEGMAKIVAQENGIPMPEQMGNPKTAVKAGNEENIPVLEERAPGLIQSDDGKIKVNTTKKMHQDGKHYNKHGRTMGYASKKEYDQAAKEFAIANMDNQEAKIYRGKWNGNGGYGGKT